MQFEAVLKRARLHSLRKNPILVLLLGGAAVYRRDSRRIFIAAFSRTLSKQIQTDALRDLRGDHNSSTAFCSAPAISSGPVSGANSMGFPMRT